jgi:hypothetical protein
VEEKQCKFYVLLILKSAPIPSLSSFENVKNLTQDDFVKNWIELRIGSSGGFGDDGDEQYIALQWKILISWISATEGRCCVTEFVG